MKEFEGRPAVIGGVGKDLVNEPMIRHWCEAMGDTNPAYRGPHAVAPPTMLQAWTMGGLSGHSRPQGQDVDRGQDLDLVLDEDLGHDSAHDEMFALLESAGYGSVVATDCEQEYLLPLRPGQQITFDAVIESVSPRKRTALGTGHFITTRMDVRADGELAGTHRFRILKYAPANRRPQGTTPGAAPPRGPVAARRPRPVVNRDNAGFWEGVSAHQLLIQRCTACARLRFPWLPGCNACGSDAWDTVPAAGTGTVFSYVVMHHPPFPAFDPPYAVGLVELTEGVRIVAGLTGVPYDRVRIGMPVELEFHRFDEDPGDAARGGSSVRAGGSRDATDVPVFRVVGEPAAAATESMGS
ncbi:OB-fold domain-containing protein [Streptomyces sp. NPDC048057]|uniref:bifunctional MaoC family dehydratase N-terminal/OB-fold nucleic acid binding domain-containing protein n=1 Tax=Streptomyces sp. NPDC048057 TaxID=3155628 RepID=UPI0033E2A797